MKTMKRCKVASESDPASRSKSSQDLTGDRPAHSPAALEELKQQLLQEKAKALPDATLFAGLHRAAEEAASLAWTTAYPLLVLPELFAEKAAQAIFRSQRQHNIRERSRDLVTQAG